MRRRPAPRFCNADGNYYPHRVDLIGSRSAAAVDKLGKVRFYCVCLEIRVYRLTPTSWQLKGGPGKVNFTCDDPWSLSWADLSGQSAVEAGEPQD